MRLRSVAASVVITASILVSSPRAQVSPGADTRAGKTFMLDPLTRLVELEEIRQLKARYMRYLDTGERAKLATVFGDPIALAYTDNGEIQQFDTEQFYTFIGINGRPNAAPPAPAAQTLDELARARRVHHGHEAEIEFTSPTTARGYWAFADITGDGHYREEYTKGPYGWRISSMRLTRLRFDQRQLELPQDPAILYGAFPQAAAAGASPAARDGDERLARLIEIEQIKELRARYFRLLDTKRWSDLRKLLTDDLQWRSEDPGLLSAAGADSFIADLSKRLTGAATVHQAHMPEIQITGATTASGIWSIYDSVDLTKSRPSERSYRAWGHYHEDYVKGADGAWRIRSIRLTRLKVDPLDASGPTAASGAGR